jgi:gamma-butyrobetaine dioxygenase
MGLISVSHDDCYLTLDWDGNRQTKHALIWMRDNDPSGFHPTTGERVFDLLSVPENPQLVAGAVEANELNLTWSDGHTSRITEADLVTRISAPAGSRTDTPVRAESWDGSFANQIPRHSADSILKDDKALLSWLEDLTKWGLTIVEEVACETGAMESVCRRVAHLRETNFGLTFDVRSIPKPNNQAYTADALPLHTDLTNQETPPGFQFLHTLRNDAQGGESLFADGIRMAEDLRKADPDAYRVLTKISIPCRFYDDSFDIRYRRPIIREDRNGQPVEVNYNAHLADYLDLEPEETIAFYHAYRAFMRLTRDAHYRIEMKSRSGDMVAFNNRRTLHGRNAFDPNTGARHLRGCYLDWTDVMSRIRVLQR